MVGAEGFEPPTSCSQSRRATRLRYAPFSSNQTRMRIILFEIQVVNQLCASLALKSLKQLIAASTNDRITKIKLIKEKILSKNQNIDTVHLATKEEVYKLESKLLNEIIAAKLSLQDFKLLITTIVIFALVIISTITSSIYIRNLH